MTALKILFISLCCLVCGAAGICLTHGGPASILGAPVLALFGWYFLCPIYLLVALMWLFYLPRLTAMPWRILFVLGGAMVGGGVIAIWGSNAKDSLMYEGMVLGGILAGGLSNLLITLLKSHAVEPSASPNGGPVAPLGNAGVTQGPPPMS